MGETKIIVELPTAKCESSWSQDQIQILQNETIQKISELSQKYSEEVWKEAMAITFLENKTANSPNNLDVENFKNMHQMKFNCYTTSLKSIVERFMEKNKLPGLRVKLENNLFVDNSGMSQEDPVESDVGRETICTIICIFIVFFILMEYILISGKTDPARATVYSSFLMSFITIIPLLRRRWC